MYETFFVLTLLGNRVTIRALLDFEPQRGDAMTRWMQRRKRYQQTRNAFLLLTISGAVRSADVEVPYFRERRLRKQSGGNSGADLEPHVKQSIWFMDLRKLFSPNASATSRGSKVA